MAHPLSNPMFSLGKFTGLVQESSGSTLSMREFIHPGASFFQKTDYRSDLGQAV